MFSTVVEYNIYIQISIKFLFFIGPHNDGSFRVVKVQTVHRNKAPCRLVHSSQSASLTLDPPQVSLRPGMVIISALEKPQACYFFQVS